MDGEAVATPGDDSGMVHLPEGTGDEQMSTEIDWEKVFVYCFVVSWAAMFWVCVFLAVALVLS